MREDIKNRIEQISRGEVPDGYKELKKLKYIVPNDWNEVKLNTLFSKLTRKNNENNQNVLTISAQYGLINQEDFFNKSIASDDKSNYYLLERGDFAYNKSYSKGYPLGVIKSLKLYEKGIVSPLYICFRKNNCNIDYKYFEYYFENGLFNREIMSIAQEGARNHGLLNVPNDDFFNLSVVLPNHKEQQKIAEILSTQDKIIELKQNLIEQKKLQRKYLIENIFDKNKVLNKIGNTKIEKQNWKQLKLGDIAQGFEYGMNSAATQYDGKNKYIRITDIDDESHKYNNDNMVSPLDNVDDNYLVKEGDILFARTGASTGKTYLYNKNDGILYFAGFLIRVNIKDNIPYIVFVQTLTERYKNWLRIMSVRSGQPGINAEEYKHLDILLPSLPEQQAIAQILSTADKEIELLQQELEQEKLKKKSLSQLLLTGIVRI